MDFANFYIFILFSNKKGSDPEENVFIFHSICQLVEITLRREKPPYCSMSSSSGHLILASDWWRQRPGDRDWLLI